MMTRCFSVLFVLSALFAIALCVSIPVPPLQECGATCSNNNECDETSSCSRCDATSGTCQQGTECNGACTVNTDCDQTSDCTICRDGLCQDLGMCGNWCANDANCFNGPCYRCLNSACTTSGCGEFCYNNNECEQAGNCSRCDLTSNTCSAGFGCSATCSVNTDCQQQGPCPVCRDGVCQSWGTCGSYCLSDANCYNGPCFTCTNNECFTPGCGVTCSNNNQCSFSTTSNCTRCDGDTHTCSVGLACNAACVVNTDCDQTGSCTVCRDETCQGFGMCGSFCDTDANCYNGPCTSCVNNACASTRKTIFDE